ncbi:hypothetical protein AAFN46_13155 [Pseudomonas sp. CAU 1711]|uniref:hypothetical protein n=1 Tax=Pseudomonas sp. CAU 1711 TaxID=3140356 RepID=UPI00326128BE
MNKERFLRRLLALMLFVLSPALLAAEGPQLFGGTLGRMEVVVELDLRDPEQVTGRYFYRKYRHDLALEGKLQGAQLSLREGRERYDDIPRPELQLQRTAQGWQGEWRGPQGKRLVVSLSRLSVEPPPTDDEPFWQRIHAESPYDFLRLKASPLEPSKRQRFMGHELQWWREPVSGLTAFEVLDGYPPAQLALINQRLRERLWTDVIDYHGCKLGGDEFMQTLKPALLSAQVVSLDILTSYYCGGAHPDFSASPLTLDARTGEVLALEDVLWVADGPALLYRDDGEGRPVPGSVDFTTYSDYRSERLAPWLVEQLGRLYPDRMAEPEDDDCRYADSEVWNFPAWYLTPEGLHLAPYFARAMRPCDLVDWPVLPYALLKQHPGRLKLRLPE